jgi:hypothetical protein
MTTRPWDDAILGEVLDVMGFRVEWGLKSS